MSGLAQALSGCEEDDPDDYSLRVTRLKRALRGAAFARGVLFPLQSAVTAEQFDDLQGRLRKMEQDIFHELSRLRSDHRADASPPRCGTVSGPRHNKAHQAPVCMSDATTPSNRKPARRGRFLADRFSPHSGGPCFPS